MLCPEHWLFTISTPLCSSYHMIQKWYNSLMPSDTVTQSESKACVCCIQWAGWLNCRSELPLKFICFHWDHAVL